MKVGRCPVCKSHLALDAIVQDKATQELLTRVAQLDAVTAGALVSYLALFRTNTRDLANDRALVLISEIEALSDDWLALTIAMQRTVEQTRKKPFKQMKNHNYLKPVLDDVIDQGNYELIAIEQTNNVLKNNGEKSKTVGALEKLQGMKNES